MASLRDPKLQERFDHLILVPSTEPKWIVNQTKWVLKTCDEQEGLRMDSDACKRLSKCKSDCDYEYLGRLAQEAPIFYASWR